MSHLPTSLNDLETLLRAAGDALTLNRVLVGAGILFLYSNAKGLPGVWHYRLFKGLITELLFKRSRQPLPLTDAHGRPRVYSYLVTECSNPVIECDYNLHKSNSTFFADLDINRTQLMMAQFKHVLAGSCMPRSTPGSTTPGRNKPLMMAMGGVACLFHREIKPLQRYEIWSRVLAWDEKWVYVVSYFVKKGAVARDGTLPGELDKKVVLATGLARYVFKEGRVTVKPEGVLQECRLLPSGGEQKEVVGWGREEFEAENRKGLAIAGGFSGLEGLPVMTRLGEVGVLGRYADF
ncbi:acyl-CoA thioesterase [Aspergillus saccharolyticus JOP 1030-1]|uniref:Capsule polysaccharide biosynthesis protein n=1 Tax=Aspergillus saccharolyticus JOP 1030-1 TaxID=1450539 RepID=A0A318ZHT5_9EURO|nr:hypothetical protein BP01DRAFT_337890 [Aspergillus saccharolyticus JOP 1030-1]PYH46495.1 hypothetical protein BP01DRAFT_337890 [Aspergillus saccharolyticus JOP 1030-1]